MKATGVEKPVGANRINENLAITTALATDCYDERYRQQTHHDLQALLTVESQRSRSRVERSKIASSRQWISAGSPRCISTCHKWLCSRKSNRRDHLDERSEVNASSMGRKRSRRRCATSAIHVPHRSARQSKPAKSPKAASTSSATTGDTVDFVLRFDNIGDQVIGNVTIIDGNASVTRLGIRPGLLITSSLHRPSSRSQDEHRRITCTPLGRNHRPKLSRVKVA